MKQQDRWARVLVCVLPVISSACGGAPPSNDAAIAGVTTPALPEVGPSTVPLGPTSPVFRGIEKNALAFGHVDVKRLRQLDWFQQMRGSLMVVIKYKDFVDVCGDDPSNLIDEIAWSVGEHRARIAVGKLALGEEKVIHCISAFAHGVETKVEGARTTFLFAADKVVAVESGLIAAGDPPLVESALSDPTIPDPIAAAQIVPLDNRGIRAVFLSRQTDRVTTVSRYSSMYFELFSDAQKVQPKCEFMLTDEAAAGAFENELKAELAEAEKQIPVSLPDPRFWREGRKLSVAVSSAGTVDEKVKFVLAALKVGVYAGREYVDSRKGGP